MISPAVPLTGKIKYGAIVVDPPWSFDDKGSRAAPDWLDKFKYQTMSDEDILALPVKRISAVKSHLYLWTTDAHIKLALRCITKWGFTYKMTVPWVKRRPMDDAAMARVEAMILAGAPPKKVVSALRRAVAGPLQIGMGHYLRHAHEICLFAVRGKLGVNDKGVASVLEAPRQKHSQKPDKLQDMVERLSPGPYIELFARRKRDNWTIWGAQAPGDDNVGPTP
jgi:N6-adenosine-specific RNA methylase IME4